MSPEHQCGRVPEKIRWRSIWWAGWVAYVLAGCALLPTAAYSYDEGGLLGGAFKWLHYGLPLFGASKFGANLTIVALLAEGLRHLFLMTGLMSGVAALHIAWKVPLLLANVFTVISLCRLARRWGRPRAARFGYLWLANPAAFWVAAGHGQIEPLTVMTTIVGLDLLLCRRPIVAGLVIAFGAGLEYFPLAVLVGGFVLLWRRELSLTALLRATAATAGGLLIWFGPLVLSVIDRAGLTEALGQSIGTTRGTALPESPYGLSVWSLVPNGSEPPTVLVAILFLAACALVLAWGLVGPGRRLRPERTAVSVVGGLLIVSVLADPISSPQFAVIAGGGLFLLALAVELPVVVAAALPVAGIAVYLVEQSPWIFFQDEWAQRSVQLPTLPYSPSVAVVLAHFFTVGCLCALGWMLVLRKGDGSGTSAWTGIGHASMDGALVASWMLCALLGSLGAWPTLWPSIGPGGPRNGADLSASSAIVTNNSVSVSSAGTITVHYPRLAAKMLGAASVRPRLAVALGIAQPSSPFRPWELSTAVARVIRLRVPFEHRSDVTSLWLVALLGSPAWRRPSAVRASAVSLVVGGRRVQATSAEWSSPTWVLADFAIPASLEDDGVLSLRAPPPVTRWDGWIDQPAGAAFGALSATRSIIVPGVGAVQWTPQIRILPRSGTIRNEGVTMAYRVGDPGAGIPVAVVRATRFSATFALPLRDLPFQVSGLEWGGYVFPRTSVPSAKVMLENVLGWVWLFSLGCAAIVAVAWWPGGRGFPWKRGRARSM
ncbi:MAG: glycosyltransferase 87 family protein [Actinomycetota bacterium]|nr:glycosyltransferase 87 family protein [Actinomycetota bacterium]